MNVLFVDHSFHKKTASSQFFQDLLAAHFNVTILNIDPEKQLPDLAKCTPESTDIVVIWQLDYLAPIFIAMGLRVVVVPMYDGSAHMPDPHWLMCKGAHFINFSRRMHFKISRCGVSSMLVKYFKPPVPERELKSFKKLRVFLWQRRPEQGINLHMVEQLFGKQVESIHIHDAPDDANLDTAKYLIPTSQDIKITTSRWFANATDYAKLLDENNVFIAPRLAEGIGMSVIEAMARGMLVVAADDATHDEYLANWINGILINPNAVSYADLHERSEAIGRMAWRTAQIGSEHWLASLPGLIEYIAATPAPIQNRTNHTPDWASALVAHYFEGMDIYCNFLQRNIELVEKLANAPVREKLDAAGRFDPSIQRQVAQRMLVTGTDHFSWLDQNRFVASLANSSRFVIEGRASFERDCAWLLDDGITLGFLIDPDINVTDFLEIQYQLASTLGNTQQYLLILNGRSVGHGIFVDGNNTRRHEIPPGVLLRANLLRVQLIYSRTVQGEIGHKCSVGIERIAFV